MQKGRRFLIGGLSAWNRAFCLSTSRRQIVKNKRFATIPCGFPHFPPSFPQGFREKISIIIHSKSMIIPAFSRGYFENICGNSAYFAVLWKPRAKDDIHRFCIICCAFLLFHISAGKVFHMGVRKKRKTAFCAPRAARSCAHKGRRTGGFAPGFGGLCLFTSSER